MDKILNKSHIRIKEKAADWEEAIRKAGAVLVEAGSIRPAYVEKMIQSVRELGPYIVIMPGFALAHAAPCEEVLKSDVALITLETPVEFGSPNDPVSVVLCLGCTDSTSHLDTLSGIAETLLAEEKMEQGLLLLDIEPMGAKQVKQSAPDAVLIFIMPPSREELERRLRSRGDTSEEQIKMRLERASWEMEQRSWYDYTVVNDDAKRCAEEILTIIANLAD